MNNLVVREQILKTVVKSGNGGAVWVPKAWLGEDVVVILPERPKIGLNERIIHLLEPHLKDIISVAIYGSHARNEQEEASDVDVLVITSGKKLHLRLNEPKIDIISLPIEKLKTAIERHPVLYYQIVKEAVPLINASVLDELKQIRIGKLSFRAYLKETKEHLASSRALLELDKIDGISLKSYSVLYSALLRLRGLFIIRTILVKENFSNRKFRAFLLSKGLSIKEFKDAYAAFRLVRGNVRPRNLRMKVTVAEKILNILENELNSLQVELND